MSASAYDAMWDVHLEAIRRSAHQLLSWAYADLRRQLNAEMPEPDITGLFAGAMRNRLNARDTPETFDHYCVGDEEPVSPQGELGTKRPRMDITVTLTGVSLVECTCSKPSDCAPTDFPSVFMPERTGWAASLMSDTPETAPRQRWSRYGRTAVSPIGKVSFAASSKRMQRRLRRHFEALAD